MLFLVDCDWPEAVSAWFFIISFRKPHCFAEKRDLFFILVPRVLNLFWSAFLLWQSFFVISWGHNLQECKTKQLFGFLQNLVRNASVCQNDAFSHKTWNAHFIFPKMAGVLSLGQTEATFHTTSRNNIAWCCLKCCVYLTETLLSVNSWYQDHLPFLDDMKAHFHLLFYRTKSALMLGCKELMFWVAEYLFSNFRCRVTANFLEVT